MNNFSDEELMNLIQLAQTISEDRRRALRFRLAEELDSDNEDLSPQLKQELIELFHTEIDHIQKHSLPQVQKDYEILASRREEKLESIRPQLNAVVHDYEKETSQLLKEHNETFRVLEGEFDQAAQEILAVDEEDQIAAWKAKLTASKSNS
jgi:hypothetical protein